MMKVVSHTAFNQHNKKRQKNKVILWAQPWIPTTNSFVLLCFAAAVILHNRGGYHYFRNGIAVAFAVVNAAILVALMGAAFTGFTEVSLHCIMALTSASC